MSAFHFPNLRFAAVHLTAFQLLYITKTRLCNILQDFTAVKIDDFQMNFFYIFLIFAQNIDCWYTLEPPK